MSCDTQLFTALNAESSGFLSFWFFSRWVEMTEGMVSTSSYHKTFSKKLSSAGVKMLNTNRKANITLKTFASLHKAYKIIA